MARSSRATATVSTPSTPITPVVASAAAGPGTPGTPLAVPAAATAGPSRRSTRRTLAAATTSTPSSSSATPASAPSPASSGPLTPADPNHTPTSSRHGGIPKAYVAPKAHGLRNSSNARERTPCPFPADHGGNAACGVADDDEADDVLMAICSACAALGNLALSPDELASIAFDHGWLRPPSIAVQPATMIQNAIRMHQSRCSKANPSRKPLLSKYQLAGSTAEAVLAPALHPNAFDGPVRPKGPVWYLSPDVGRANWRNPFTGLVVPKAPARKPAAPKPPKATKPKKDDGAKAAGNSGACRNKEKQPNSKEPTLAETGTPPPTLPRIKLRVSAAAATDTAPSTPGDESDIDTSSRFTSRSMTVDSVASAPPSQPQPSQPSLLPPPLLVSSTPVRKQRQRRNVFDSSDSESSSDDDEVPIPRQRQARRIVLPPLAAGAGARITPAPIPPRPTAQTPLGALFSPLATGPLPLPPLTQASPFPHHSLDNTIWAARGNIAHVTLDASSSSSDDELCDDWGRDSGLMIKGDDDELVPWPQTQDEDPKLREATTAMQELFPREQGSRLFALEPAFNQLDNNRPTRSDTSSLTDTATLNAVFQGKLKNAACPAALPAWALSSPVSSPNLVGRTLPAVVETSPTQYLRVARDYAADRSMEMDVDVALGDEAWLDESGQLPVHAEDSFSDVEFASTLGDLPTPECERRLQTAVWARQTAQSTVLLVKQEPEDYYPSPAATNSTEPDDSSVVSHQESRESTASAPSPSSGSELTPYEYSDEEHGPEFLVGPESIGMDELDDWLPSAAKAMERTPLRGRRLARNDPSRCSDSWVGIGVVPPAPMTPPPLVRKRSLRSCSRRNNRSTPRKPDSSSNRLPLTTTPVQEPELVPELESEPDLVLVTLDSSSPLQPETIDIDLELEDAIGADELEQARVDAEAREEEYRAEKRAEAEENRRRWQACRRAFANAAASGSRSESPSMAPTPNGSMSLDGGQVTPWLETSGMWSSTDSVAELVTPSCLSPLALQIAPMCGDMMSFDPKALLSPPHGNMMVLDSVLSQADIDAANALLSPPPVQAPPPPPVPQQIQPQQQPNPPPQPQPALQPSARSVSTSPKLSTSPKVSKRPIAPRVEPKKIAPKQILPRPDPANIAPKPLAPAPQPVIAPAPAPPAPAPAPVAVPVAAPAPTRAPAPAAPVVVPAPAPPVVPTPAPAPAPVVAPVPVPAAPPPRPAPAPATVAPAPTPAPAVAPMAPTAAAPTVPKVTPATATATTTAAATPRTVSPVARTATTSPAVSTTSTNSSVAASRASTPSSSGGTTKRLLPGIDACVIDNLPCYSHVYELPSGKKCTVLRRLDTDFVNGTALLTAIGVAPEKQIEVLQAPGPTVQSHRSVPLISPQGQQHAAGVPGVWIPLVTARDLARKLGLPDNKLLSNILREDLFQLFKELAGISLLHTTSTDFGVPFVTQPYPRKPMQQPNRQQVRPGMPVAGKGPLVRGPVAPPDGVPNAKRRRSVAGQPGVPVAANGMRQPMTTPASVAAARAAAAAAVRPLPQAARPMPAKPAAMAPVPGMMRAGVGVAMVKPGVGVQSNTPAQAAAHGQVAAKAGPQVPRPIGVNVPPAPVAVPTGAVPAAIPALPRRTRASIGAK